MYLFSFFTMDAYTGGRRETVLKKDCIYQGKSTIVTILSFRESLFNYVGAEISIAWGISVSSVTKIYTLY